MKTVFSKRRFIRAAAREREGATTLQPILNMLLLALLSSYCVPVLGAILQLGAPQHPGNSNAEKPSFSRIDSPSIVDWDKGLKIPDDILFSRHGRVSKNPLIFLVSVDASGRTRDIRPISGFSLYFPIVGEQIKNSVFDSTSKGRTFLIRIPDPLGKYLTDSHMYHTGVCSPTSATRTLYELGALLWRNTDNDAALHCYKYILDSNPESIAARFGVAEICLSTKDTCAGSYLQSLIHTNPEFIEARRELAYEREISEGDEAYISELGQILELEISPSERISILSQQIFWSDKLNHIQDAKSEIRQWNEAASDLIHIYPPSVSPYDTEAIHYGLLEESLGDFIDAIESYSIAAAIAKDNRLVAEQARFDIDMGLARTKRRTGDTGAPRSICNQWKSKWRRLVGHPVHHQWELREEGHDEIEGKWELSCGSQEKGFELIQEAVKNNPESTASYEALAEYYYSVGEIKKAREADAKASELFKAWERKVNQF